MQSVKFQLDFNETLNLFENILFANYQLVSVEGIKCTIFKNVNSIKKD